MQWSTLDPALPALPLALDAAAVGQRFCQQWPAGPAPLLKVCRRQEIQYSPARHCIATYALVVAPAGAAPYQTIVVVEVTPAALSQRSFMADFHLEGLATAGAVATMAERFAALVQVHGPAKGGALLAVTPLRYKPGVRCALRYDVQSAQGPTAYFGKLVAQQSAHLAQTIVLLAEASQAEPALPHIAPLLAYWPDLHLLLQAAMPGAELHTVAFDERLDMTTRKKWLWLAGRTMAALHSLDVAPGCPGIAPPQQLAGDIAGLATYTPALRQVNPALADRFVATATAITDSIAQSVEERPVVSHGALRTDQFLLDADHLVLIDLDSVGWASPARDLGNFLAYLTWKALRQPHHAAFIEQAQAAFLAGYQTLRPLPQTAWLTFYQAAAQLKIIGRRYTGLTVQEWPLTATLLEQTRTLLTRTP